MQSTVQKGRQFLPLPEPSSSQTRTGNQGAKCQSLSCPISSLVPDSLQTTMESGSQRAFHKPHFSACPPPQPPTHAGHTQVPTAATKAPGIVPPPTSPPLPQSQWPPCHLLGTPGSIKPSLFSITGHFPGFCLSSSFAVLVLPETSHLQRPLTPTSSYPSHSLKRLYFPPVLAFG